MTSPNVWNWGSDIALDTYTWDNEYSVILGEKIPIDIVESILMSN